MRLKLKPFGILAASKIVISVKSLLAEMTMSLAARTPNSFNSKCSAKPISSWSGPMECSNLSLHLPGLCFSNRTYLSLRPTVKTFKYMWIILKRSYLLCIYGLEKGFSPLFGLNPPWPPPPPLGKCKFKPPPLWLFELSLLPWWAVSWFKLVVIKSIFLPMLSSKIKIFLFKVFRNIERSDNLETIFFWPRICPKNEQKHVAY